MKKRVLFVCIGNAVRSQIAEGFARVYGWDCVAPASGGLTPASRIDPMTLKVMSAIGIDVADQFPKHYAAVTRMEFDLIVNISGHSLPGELPRSPVLEWEVDDPVGQAEEKYREARDLIQKLTLGLVDEIRNEAPAPMTAPKAQPRTMILDRKRRLRQSS